MKNPFLRPITRVLFAALCIVVLSAHTNEKATPEKKAYIYRDSLFKSIHWKFSMMIEAKKGGDQASFSRHAQDLAHLSGMVIDGFELKDNIPKGSLSKQAIWDNWQDFSDRAASFQKNSTELASTGKIESFDAKKFGTVNCGGCHRKYKEKH